VGGVAVAVDRSGRLVLELPSGAIEKARAKSLRAVAPTPDPPYRVRLPPPEGACPAAVAWKAAVDQATLAADQAAFWGVGADPRPGRSGLEPGGGGGGRAKSSKSKSGRRGSSSVGGGGSGSSSGKVARGSGPGYLAPGAEPGLREWACELCSFLNGQFARRCGACGQGSQAKSMVGRAVQTTSGPGRVAVSSGKGWVVVETASGGSYRMRLSTLWDYTVDTAAAAAASTAAAAAGAAALQAQQASGAGSGGAAAAAAAQAAAGVLALQAASAALQTASGYALPLPAQRAGDPGMPKNWSFSLLKKRVQTSHGAGVVTDVIDKGWIGVRLESGKKIKTRPGNVTALEGDEVIVSFAKKTKATHATRPPLRLAAAAGAHRRRRRRSSSSGGGSDDGGDDDEDAYSDEDEDDGGDDGGENEGAGPLYGEAEPVAAALDEDQRRGAQRNWPRAKKRPKRHGVVTARRTVDFGAGGVGASSFSHDDDMALDEPRDEGDEDKDEEDNEEAQKGGGVSGPGAGRSLGLSKGFFTGRSRPSAYPSEASTSPLFHATAQAFKIGAAVECRPPGAVWCATPLHHNPFTILSPPCIVPR
jgi:hypothetical protein